MTINDKIISKNDFNWNGLIIFDSNFNDNN